GVREAAEGFMVADNQISKLNKWRRDVLEEIVNSQKALGVKIEHALALTQDDLGRMFREVSTERVTEPEIPTAPTKATAKLGEVWKLGPHRIACVDSTIKKQLAGLFDDTPPVQLVFTDPPYGIQYERFPDGGERELHARKLAGDDLHGDGLTKLVGKSMRWAAAYAADDAAFYIWHSPSTRREFEDGILAAGLQVVTVLVWTKTLSVGWLQSVRKHTDYQTGYEPCFYAAKDGHRPLFTGDRMQTSVWEIQLRLEGGDLAVAIAEGIKLFDSNGNGIFIKRGGPKSHKIRSARIKAGQQILLVDEKAAEELADVWAIGKDPGQSKYSYLHPTQKPMALAERAIKNNTRTGDIVYDAFAGSGTTLMAAETHGRIARLAEIDPRYVDVIIERWETMTSGKAKRAK
ncbi:hypothetical protein LCGC14_2771390, partial [marine sediment metagenome]